ncbi:hypothetical protein [Candidatus Palauibacter sp.]|uniref:hypothetical protein n=1 Tax=Candidatus Palauibacter sp. TaxID=3101350 RepID=UPI003C702A5F
MTNDAGDEMRQRDDDWVELVRRNHGGGIDFHKLEASRRRLGIEGDGKKWPKEYDDPALSRRVLGLDRE